MDIQNKILTRGGEFIVRETNCEEIFTPEDFNDEQKMMREAVKEFADKEIWSKKHEFEKHNYELTEKVMEKARKEGRSITSVISEAIAAFFKI